VRQLSLGVTLDEKKEFLRKSADVRGQTGPAGVLAGTFSVLAVLPSVG
jgi:hypothetical protein